MQRKENYIARKAQLAEEIEKLRKEIEKYPKGTLVVNNSRKHPQWMVQKKMTDGSYKRTYINKKNFNLAKKLARKSYARAVLTDKLDEQKCIRRYLRGCREKSYLKYLQPSSPYRSLLVDTTWENAPYDKNQNYPEHLIVTTLKGDLVRSKSEALIANELLSYGIPYRYENGIDFEGTTFYPDFTVKSQKNQRIIIWEHFGKIDDPDYVAKTARKLQTYFNTGYVPGVNFLMTFEDRRHPLTLETVRDMIEKYLI